MGTLKYVEMVPRALSTISPFTSRMIVLLLALSLRANVNADEGDDKGICPDGANVDLTNAKRNGTGFFTEYGQFFPTEVAWKTNASWLGCMCDVAPCVLLCSSESRKNSTEFVGPEFLPNISFKIPSVYTTNFSPEDDEYPVEPEDLFHVFVWNSCIGDWGNYFVKDLIANTNDEMYLLKNSSLFLSDRNGTEGYLLDWRWYCLQQQPDHTTYTVRVCYKKESRSLFDTLYDISLFISMLCFIATIFVYSVLPELRNNHGKTFRCYLCCLLVSYIMVSAMSVLPPEDILGTACLIFGYIRYFFIISCFLWLNVMCFDMWWTFGGCRSFRSSGNLQDRKRFIWYSIYTWGISTLMSATCIGLDYYPAYLPESIIRPNLSDVECWFDQDDTLTSYIIVPLGTMIACNSFFFVLTSVRLVQHKRNTQRQLSHSDSQRHDVNEGSFSLYVKLFVIMGMNWSVEVISWRMKEPLFFWNCVGLVTALQGVPIFVMFICQRKIWQSLKIRFKYCQNSNDSDVLRSAQVHTSNRFLSHNSAETYA